MRAIFNTKIERDIKSKRGLGQSLGMLRQMQTSK